MGKSLRKRDCDQEAQIGYSYNEDSMDEIESQIFKVYVICLILTLLQCVLSFFLGKNTLGIILTPLLFVCNFIIFCFIEIFVVGVCCKNINSHSSYNKLMLCQKLLLMLFLVLNVTIIVLTLYLDPNSFGLNPTMFFKENPFVFS
ncbi:hypothetical protein COBT_000466 [Conglomerata obtusa]